MVLTTHGAKPRMWGIFFASKHPKSKTGMNLTVVLKGTQNYYSYATF